MNTPGHDPDKLDPTNSSGRPLMVMGMFAVGLTVLVVMLVIGIVVL